LTVARPTAQWTRQAIGLAMAGSSDQTPHSAACTDDGTDESTGGSSADSKDDGSNDSPAHHAAA
jgi:hypothetical protein